MGKNIVILIGSPRPKGSTAALARAFAEGARSSGHNVTEFFLGGMEIHGCKACRGGRSDRDFPCVQHDGMDEIYPAVRGCDVLVLASPLYYWNLSGPLMTAINRLFALEEGGENLLRAPWTAALSWKKPARSARASPESKKRLPFVRGGAFSFLAHALFRRSSCAWPRRKSKVYLR